MGMQRMHGMWECADDDPRRKRKTGGGGFLGDCTPSEGRDGSIGGNCRRKSRRKVLRLTGAVLLLVAGLGGAAAAGWLAAGEPWVERRLLAELHNAGLETDARHLRELSWAGRL
jgi:hypothetical protein